MDNNGLGFVNAKNMRLNELDSETLVKCKKIVFEIFQNQDIVYDFNDFV